MRREIFVIALAAAATVVVMAHTAVAAGDADRGAKLFRACAPCHSVQPDRNMTGPSLAGIWGRKAGTLASFDRFSSVLKSTDVVWDADTLDRWLKDPAQFIPDNRMTFQGIADATARGDLIAYLKVASSGAPQAAQQGDAGGMMGGMASEHPDLKKLEPGDQVKAIRYCRDTYHVTTGDGETHDFWEANLRFKTDSSELGPPTGAPAILPAGMMGDRASVIFAKPEEISALIKRQC